MSERVLPIAFACQGATLIGLLHAPERAKRRGVVIVLGAPQYRAGSHRQFLLLARDLTATGFPVLRFDYRGIGDSEGDFAGFEAVHDDIKAAIDTLFDHVPELEDVVLWGLCDGASAIAFYAAGDPRVSGAILVNPWVRSDVTVAQARVKHYYRERLLSPALWRKILSGRFRAGASLRGLAANLRVSRRRGAAGGNGESASANLPARIGQSIQAFGGRVLVVLCGGDLTAQEFDEAVLKSHAMSAWLSRANVTVRRLAGANHTYSTREWRTQVHTWIRDWLDAGP